MHEGPLGHVASYLSFAELLPLRLACRDLYLRDPLLPRVLWFPLHRGIEESLPIFESVVCGPSYNRLTQLDCRGLTLSADQLGFMVALPNLRHLKLGWIQDFDPAALSTASKLETLSVEGLLRPGTSLGSLPKSLQELDISCFTPPSLAGLAALASLRRLDCASVGDASLAPLRDMHELNWASFRAQAWVTDAQVLHLSELPLETLNLIGTGVSSAVLACLPPTLRCLTLPFAIRDGECASGALGGLTSLRLDSSRADLTLDGLPPGLRSLTLSSRVAGGEVVHLGRMNQLRRLHIFHPQPAVVWKELGSVGLPPSLEELGLEYVRLPADFLAQLASRKHLKRILLDKKVSVEDAMKLARAMPKTAIVHRGELLRP